MRQHKYRGHRHLPRRPDYHEEPQESNVPIIEKDGTYWLEDWPKGQGPLHIEGAVCYKGFRGFWLGAAWIDIQYVAEHKDQGHEIVARFIG